MEIGQKKLKLVEKLGTLRELGHLKIEKWQKNLKNVQN